jgi:hypothetical protein
MQRPNSSREASRRTASSSSKRNSDMHSARSLPRGGSAASTPRHHRKPNGPPVDTDATFHEHMKFCDDLIAGRRFQQYPSAEYIQKDRLEKLAAETQARRMREMSRMHKLFEQGNVEEASSDILNRRPMNVSTLVSDPELLEKLDVMPDDKTFLTGVDALVEETARANSVANSNSLPSSPTNVEDGTAEEAIESPPRRESQDRLQQILDSQGKPSQADLFKKGNNWDRVDQDYRQSLRLEKMMQREFHLVRNELTPDVLHDKLKRPPRTVKPKIANMERIDQLAQPKAVDMEDDADLQGEVINQMTARLRHMERNWRRSAEKVERRVQKMKMEKQALFDAQKDARNSRRLLADSEEKWTEELKALQGKLNVLEGSARSWVRSFSMPRDDIRVEHHTLQEKLLQSEQENAQLRLALNEKNRRILRLESEAEIAAKISEVTVSRAITGIERAMIASDIVFHLSSSMQSVFRCDGCGMDALHHHTAAATEGAIVSKFSGDWRFCSPCGHLMCYRCREVAEVSGCTRCSMQQPNADDSKPSTSVEKNPSFVVMDTVASPVTVGEMSQSLSMNDSPGEESRLGTTLLRLPTFNHLLMMHHGLSSASHQLRMFMAEGQSLATAIKLAESGPPVEEEVACD